MSRVNDAVAGMFDSTIRNAAVIGTANRAPVTPHNHPQKNREMNTTSRDKFKASPSSLGSRMVPVRIWAAVTQATTAKGVNPPPNWAKENNDTAPTAPIDPILGMKLRRKVSNPQTTANWTPKASKIRVVTVPTARLINVLTLINRRSDQSISCNIAGIRLSGFGKASFILLDRRCFADRNSSANKNTRRNEATPRKTDRTAPSANDESEGLRSAWRSSCRGSKESSTPVILAIAVTAPAPKLSIISIIRG